MKKVFSFLLLLSFFATACAAPTSTPAPAQALVIENTAEATFTPIPTLTEEAQALIAPTEDVPTSTPSIVLAGEMNVIQFQENGTYADIADSLGVGSSKTYSINAMGGQIMSISTLPQIPDGNWGYVSLNIKGTDGTALCPKLPDTACTFWRGVLPSSQNYTVTLTTDTDMDTLPFVMRVAINPPGKAYQYFQYTNEKTGLALTYPDTFAPSGPVYGNYKIPPELTLHFIDSKSYEKTNLSEAFLFVGSSSDAQIVATCTDPNPNAGGFEQITDNEVVNGYTFVHSTSGDAGAGNFYQEEIYRMVNENVCYEVIYFIHSTNIGNYTLGTVNEFDKEALMQQFNSIFSTFTIN